MESNELVENLDNIFLEHLEFFDWELREILDSLDLWDLLEIRETLDIFETLLAKLAKSFLVEILNDKSLIKSHLLFEWRYTL